MQKTSSSAQRLSRNMALLSRVSKRVGQNMQDAGNKITSKFSLPAAAGMTGVIASFSTFEKGLTNVLTLLDDEAIKNLGPQLKSASLAAVDAGFTIGDANKALFDTISALGGSEKSLEAFSLAQKLAIAGVTDLSIASDGLTSVMNAYGKEVTDANEVANAFFSAQRGGKTTVEELANNIGKVAPAAKLAGVGFKELLSAVAQLTLGGLSTEQATTSLSSALASLIKPSKEAEKVLKKFKVPFGATQIKAKGLQFTLEKLAIATKKNPDALAEMIPSVEALRAIGGLTSKELANMDKIIKSINKDIKEGTGLNSAYAKQQSTVSRMFSELTGEFKVFLTAVGDAISPIIKAGIFILRGLVAVLNDLTPAGKFVIGTLLGLGAVVGPLIFGLGTLLKVFGATALGAKVAGTAFLLFSKMASVARGAVLLFNLALFANPVGIVIGAVVLLIGLLATLSKSFRKFIVTVLKFVLPAPLEKLLGLASNPEIAGEIALKNKGVENNSNVDINIRDRGGAVESVSSGAKGPGLNLGVNMQGSLAGAN
jgi:TP901 family phage tail tape measure protein